MIKALAVLLCVLCLGGCGERVTGEGGKRHICTIKEDSPMHGATYCEWNYARGYADGLDWVRENEKKFYCISCQKWDAHDKDDCVLYNYDKRLPFLMKELQKEKPNEN